MTTFNNDPAAGPSVASFLEGGGGASTPAAKFPTIGTTYDGVIVGAPRVIAHTDYHTKQQLTWPNGDPRWQLVVKIQTDSRDGAEDDGVRALYVKGMLKRAITDACRAAGVASIAEGGRLWVSYVGDVPTQGNPAKDYAAKYAAPNAVGVNAPSNPAAPVAEVVEAATLTDALAGGGVTADNAAALRDAGLAPF